MHRGAANNWIVDHETAIFMRNLDLFYSADALDAFLKRNQLTHVIRAHEVQQAGFQVTRITHVIPHLNKEIESSYMYDTH